MKRSRNRALMIKSTLGAACLMALVTAAWAAAPEEPFQAPEPAGSGPPAAEEAAGGGGAPPQSGAADTRIDSTMSTGGVGVYQGTLTSRRSGKPIAGARLTFVNKETEQVYTAVTADDGRYEVRMPTGTYRLNIMVGKKSYGGSGSFKEEIPGKLWSLDFMLERKLSDQDFELSATPREVLVKPVFTPRPTPRNKWAEFFTFLGAVIGIGALAD